MKVPKSKLALSKLRVSFQFPELHDALMRVCVSELTMKAFLEPIPAPAATLRKQQTFLAKYRGKASISETGRSSAPWEALGKPQRLVSPEALGRQLLHTNTELLNRLAVGPRELPRAIFNVEENVQGLYKALWPGKSSTQSSWRSGPRLPRGWRSRRPANCSTATTRAAAHSDKVREEWPQVSAWFSAGAALTVDVAWVLQWAADGPGRLRAEDREVPLQAAAAKMTAC